MRKMLACLLIILFCSGSATLQIDSAISKYRTEASKIKIGDSKEKALSILEPTQKQLSVNCSKSPEAYMDGEDLIEIYYFRSGRQPDGLTTDDEFTPYVFKNNILVGIGWSMLGGPKSHGQVIQPPSQINQQQTTIVY